MLTAFLERTVANKIPKYPSATFWDISGSTTFIGQRHATIYFYSKDTPEKVSSYYKTELPKIGIDFIEQGKIGNLEGETGDLWVRFRKGKYGIFFTSRYYNPLKNSNYYISISEILHDSE
ncbi:hypothetical protein A3F29_03970 [Candidatus Roizmanbacteria bacterium RIFCSPHIGHO2_12_FULL_33_9]|uniref:Uncharacterized protein n=1 Tax=Candidatus Roizmanbacteria bacterium RIFCSPHIGHO2_12_FULL_33_9 TaxID=1802045 RepID=A0A1F7HIM4_9BACT|nr:MAG: hypothetical protein A3F29_03970 [Candidatus Roizmanbacteria bacterium RIFCSPHIGHO2_12_FULL_33_9]